MKTLFIGRNRIHLSSVDSTNSYAIELLRKTKPAEGSLIYTFNQQNGRGQRGNSWDSEPNENATFSLIIYPTFLSAEKQFLLTKISSLAVADLMTEMLSGNGATSETAIKWPNDIYVNNKKIAGILIETALRENTIQNAIIGIGININQRHFKQATSATSLALLTGKSFEIMPCIERFCELVEARYLQLKANKFNTIDLNYTNYLYQLNEWHHYLSGNQIFTGKITGVSKFGKLLVELPTNEIKKFDLKEIRFI